MDVMYIIVTGGRGYDDRATVRNALEKYVQDGDTVVEGGARGADRLAREEAHRLGIDVITVWANWSGHGKAAGPMRNGKMLKLFGKNLRMVIAFPGGRGTANMKEASKRLGHTVVEAVDEG